MVWTPKARANKPAPARGDRGEGLVEIRNADENAISYEVQAIAAARRPAAEYQSILVSA
jgi:hypothetical protein